MKKMKMFKSVVTILLTIALFPAIAANEASDENGEYSLAPQLQTTSAPTETISDMNASTSASSATPAPYSEQTTSPGNSHTVPSNGTAPSTTIESNSLSGESIDCVRVLTLTAYTTLVSWMLKAKKVENVKTMKVLSIRKKSL